MTPDQADYLETVKSSADSLLTIINDILDFSKIESRKLELEAVAFSLGDTIADALKPFAVRANQKGLELLCDIAPDVPAGIVGDPVRLKQIVNNLIGNAIKFTDHGHVVVSSASGDARRGLRHAALRGHRHRHRRPRQPAGGDLRGVPAGRRIHDAQVRRDRPRPRHLDVHWSR